MKNAFLSKISNRSVKIGIFGLGHIGLPKALLATKVGFPVIGADLNSKLIHELSEGRVCMYEPELREFLEEAVKRKLFKATTDGYTVAKESEVVIICVPTPISNGRKPDLSFIGSVCRTIASNLRKERLIIVESTLPPKTTETFIVPLLEKGSNLRCGTDFWLAYCPERIILGDVINELIANDRIIGGYDVESAEVAKGFYKTFVKGNISITDIRTAEVTKLAENTFRDVNIAFANQLALVCEQVGVDAMEVINLSNTHPRVRIQKPGPGVGGPCLPKDPYLLLHSLKHMRLDIIKKARQINDYMPNHFVKLIFQALRATGKKAKNSKIVVLGTTYKGDVDETKFTPAQPIIHKLLEAGMEVLVYDPYSNEAFGAYKVKHINEALKGADCLAIITDHTEFKNLDLKKAIKLMKSDPSIVDGRRLVNPYEAEKAGFFYLGVGFGKGKYS